MLFLTDSVREEIRKLAQQRMAGTISEAQLGEGLLKADPLSGAAYLALGQSRLQAGAFEEAESLFWQGLDRKPCEYPFYMALADARRKRDPHDELSIRLRALGLWKLSFAEEISDDVANAFRADSRKLDYRDPQTYAWFATAFEAQHADLDESPAVRDRLLPYRLLNDLQRQADDEVDDRLLPEILAEGARCLPLFRGALREWARNQASVSTKVVALVLALLGEIADVDLIDDLLELADFDDELIFLHTHWAIWRIGQRHPVEAMAKFRAATPSAQVTVRNALGEQINLLPEVPGAARALLDLLRDFPRFVDEPDAPHLLMIVLYGLIELHRDGDASQVLGRYRPMLPKRSRQTLDHWIESEGFLPKLVQYDINGLSIEDVCIGRALMVDEEADEAVEDESDEDDSDEEDWDDVEWDEGSDREGTLKPITATVKPGRNDQCWCGSGKKYKKCHLAADEEAERSRR